MRAPRPLILHAIIVTSCIILVIGNVVAGNAKQASSIGAPLSLDDALYQTNKQSPVPIRTREERSRLRTLGERIARNGSDPGAAACAQCHGMNGAGDTSGAFPRIAGLSVYYATKQLGDYAANARPNDVMTPIAQKLSPVEMEAVSVFYAAQDAAIAHRNDFEAPDVQWGRTIANEGIAEAGLAPCMSCHDAASARYPYSAPGLKGQYASYTALQLDLWRRGVRDNDVGNVMSDIADRLPVDAAEAVSKYYETLILGSTGEGMSNSQPESVK